MFKELTIGAAIIFMPITGNCAQSGSTVDPQYFKGKSVRVVVNYEPGSSADLFGRNRETSSQFSARYPKDGRRQQVGRERNGRR